MGDAASYVISMEDKVSGPVKSATSSLGGFDSKIKGSSENMNQGSENAVAFGGAIAIVAAIAVTAAAAVGSVVLSMAKMTLAANQAEAAQLLLAQSEYGHGPAAQAVVDAQYKVAATTSLTQQAVFDLSNELERAGVSSGKFGETLDALAKVSSVAGEESLKSIEKVIKKTEQLGTFKIKDTDLKGSGIKMAEVYDQIASNMGISVAKVKTQIKSGKLAAEDGIHAINQVLSKKFSGAAAEKALDFDNQITKAKENITNLFKGVDTKPFLSALQKVLSIFDTTTSTGKAVKSVLVGAMNGFFSAAAAVLPYVEAFILGIAIGALDMYIALKPAIATISKALGNNDKGTSSGLHAAASAGKVFGDILVMTVGTVVQGVAQIINAVHKVQAAFRAVSGAVSSVVGAVKGGFQKASAFLNGLSWASVADALIDGLVDGIKNGASKVVAAVTEMGAKAIGAAKSVFKIGSPSKVFHEVGDFNAQGLAGGHEDGASKVAKSIQHMTVIPAKAANDNASNPWRERAAPKQAAAAASSSSVQITVAAGAFVFHISGDNAKDIASEVRTEVIAIFEQLKTGTGG